MKKHFLYRDFIKRFLDLALSVMAIIILSPFYLITALLVRVKLGKPVLFCQRRPGKNEKIFSMYKFRTMTDARDSEGKLLSDEKRLTPFGKTLRSTSLDELPELLNVFLGQMSIVGPRPLLEKYLPLYNEEQKHRHDVKPGLTGLAQVNGRNAISWKDKFSYDLQYVQNVSFINDCKIIFQTVGKVFHRDGIDADTGVTMPEFTGQEDQGD